SVRPAPISSSRSTTGSVARERASSSRLRSSRPSVSPRRLAASSIRHVSSASIERRYASLRLWPPPAVAATNTFSNTVIPPKRFRSPCAASRGVPLVLTARLLAVRLQFRRDRNLLVVVVLRDPGLDLEPAARLHPLRADDRAVGDGSGNRAVGEVHGPERRG